jgi:MoxR-like ATPase
MLKVPPQAAGRQAKCPQCATVQIVPAAGNHSATAAQSMDSYGAAATSAMGPPAMANTFAAPPANPAPPASPFPVAAPVRPAQSAAFSLRESLSGGHEGRETPIKQLFDRVTDEIAKIYVGQDELVLGALVALFSSGHVLIESVPGLGKTLFVRTLGKVLGCKFGRIQFTADLMPSDITGAPIFDMKNQDFRFRPGPVFTQFLLADEINRSPAKTHAALLEIMQEYRVTIDGQAHTLERPFLVLATQNPI